MFDFLSEKGCEALWEITLGLDINFSIKNTQGLQEVRVYRTEMLNFLLEM